MARWTTGGKVAVGLGAAIGAGIIGGLILWSRRSSGIPGVDLESPPLGVTPTASPLDKVGNRTTWSDGATSVESADGTMVVIRSDGARVTQRTDGAVETRSADGSVTVDTNPPTNVPLPHSEPTGTGTGVKDPGVVTFERVTSGPSFDACMASGHRFRWQPDPGTLPGCTAVRWSDVDGRDPRRVMVTARETIRDIQRRLLRTGFFNNPDGSPRDPQGIVDGRVGTLTSAALLAYQTRFNQSMGFDEDHHHLPDGSVRQSRTPYLPITGTLDLLTASTIHYSS